MTGYRITSLDELMELAFDRKSVVVHFGRMPAAFIIQMQAAIVHRMIVRGMWLYLPTPKHSKPIPPSRQICWNPEPQPGTDVCWGNRTGLLLAYVGDSAYVYLGSGTAFVDRWRVKAITKE